MISQARVFDTPVIRIEPSSGSVGATLKELWEFRELLFFLVWRDVKVRYKQTVMGASWAILQPFFTMIIFSLFFGRLANIPSDGIPYPIFSYSALVPWTFFATGLLQASSSLVVNANMVKKIYFPRLIMPTAAILSGVLDFLLAFAVLLIAPPVMGLLELSHATGPVQGLAFVLPIAALGATHLSLRLREFGHKSLALRSVVGGTIGGAAGIAAAFVGWGIWALVVQRLVTEAVNTLMSWQAYPWIPGRNFSMAQLRTIWAFGFNIALTQIVSQLPRRAMDIILGSFIGAAAVGLNRTARRTNELVMFATVNPFNVVALQTMSRLQSDSTEMIKAYRWLVSKSSMLSCPALIGLGVLAPDAVPAVFGEKWEVSGQLVQIMTFMVVPYALSSFTSPMLLALGRGWLPPRLSVVTYFHENQLTYPLPSRDELHAWAEETPLVAEKRNGVDGARARSRLAGRELWPDFTIGVQYGQRPGDMGTERMGSLMLGFSVPVFAGSRQLRMRAEASAMERMAKAELAEARTRVDGRIGELLAELESARTLIRLYRSEVLPQADVNVSSAYGGYRVGSVDFMTLIDAQMTVNSYQEELHSLVARYGSLVAELEMTIGRELPASQPMLAEGG